MSSAVSDVKFQCDIEPETRQNSTCTFCGEVRECIVLQISRCVPKRPPESIATFFLHRHRAIVSCHAENGTCVVQNSECGHALGRVMHGFGIHSEWQGNLPSHLFEDVRLPIPDSSERMSGAVLIDHQAGNKITYPSDSPELQALKDLGCVPGHAPKTPKAADNGFGVQRTKYKKQRKYQALETTCASDRDNGCV